MKWWQGNDVKWKVVCCSEHSQLCARSSPLRWWLRLSRFGAPLVLGGFCLSQRVGALSPGSGSSAREDCVALGHAGRPESGLHKQAPRAAAPLLSAIFHGLTGDDIAGSAPAEF